jgi:hypothetical protein
MPKNKPKKAENDLFLFDPDYLSRILPFQGTLYQMGGYNPQTNLTGVEAYDDIAQSQQGTQSQQGMPQMPANIGSIGNIGATIGSETVDLIMPDQHERTNVPKERFKGYLEGTAQGAQIGSSVGGPWGALIGATLGGIRGTITSHVQAKKGQEEQHKALIERYYGSYGGFLPEMVPEDIEDFEKYSGMLQYKDGGIYIKPSKRGSFTAAAKKRGIGVQEFAQKIMANRDNYSSAMVKKANFARNSANWNRGGGYIYPDGGHLSETPDLTENMLGNYFAQRDKKFGLSPLELEEEQNRVKFPNGGKINLGRYQAERDRIEQSGDYTSPREMTLDQFKSWSKSKALPFHTDIPEGASGVTRYRGIAGSLDQRALGQYWTDQGYTYIPKYEVPDLPAVSNIGQQPAQTTPAAIQPEEKPRETLILPEFKQEWIQDDNAPGGGYYKTVKTTEERLPGDVTNLRGGGMYPKYRSRYSDGGDLNITNYNGPSHEQGGINIGPNAEVEGGEVRVEDYIFSDTLTPDGKKTYAQIAKDIIKKYEERPGDAMSQRAMKKQLSILMQENETARKQKEFESNAEDLGVLQRYGGMVEYRGGGLLIKSENRDVFSKEAKKRGKKVYEFATDILKLKRKYPHGGNIHDTPVVKSNQEKKDENFILSFAKANNLSVQEAFDMMLEQDNPLSGESTKSYQLGGEFPPAKEKKSKYGTQQYGEKLPEGFEPEGYTHGRVGNIRSAIKAMKVNKKIRQSGLDYERIPLNFFKVKKSEEIPQFRYGGKWGKKYPNGGPLNDPKLLNQYEQNLRNLEIEAQKLSDKIVAGTASRKEMKRFDELPDERLYLSDQINQLGFGIEQETGEKKEPFYKTDYSITDPKTGKTTTLSEEEGREAADALGMMPLFNPEIDSYAPKSHQARLMQQVAAQSKTPEEGVVGASKRTGLQKFGEEEAGLIAASLPAIQNLMRSISSEKTHFPRYTPEELNLDRARQATAKDEAMARAVARANVRGTGRTSGEVISGLSAQSAAITESKMASDLQSYLQEESANVATRNEAKRLNTQIAMQEYIANEQNRAMAKSLSNLGISDLGASFQGYLKDKKLTRENEKYNKEVLSLINQMFPEYRWGVDPDSDEKVIEFVSKKIKNSSGNETE